MNELLSKISSYNLFNYLFSGVLFAILAKTFTSYSFVQPDAVIAFFVYYFLGLVISRLGSLIIEPFLKKTKFIKFEDYGSYITASKKDPSIDIFSEVNNMYRTLSAVCLSVILLKLYEILINKIGIFHGETYAVLILLLIVFLFAYRKQTNYISKRIITNNKNG